MIHPVEIDGDTAFIRVAGRFDFSFFKEFQQAYEAALTAPGVATITIELSGADYIDSAALGMMLLLRQKGNAVDRRVTLAGATGSVQEVLQIANFDQFFG